MQRFRLDPLTAATHLISQLQIAVLDQNVKTFAPETMVHVLENLNRLNGELSKLGLRFTAISVNAMIANLKEGKDSVPAYRNLVLDIMSRFKDEVSEPYCLVLSANEAALFDPSEPAFGVDVENKFPSASFEIAEAGKCIAVGRYTAAGFHLMRVLEIGIKAVATCLGIPDPTRPAERNWGAILNNVRDGINAKWPKSADRMNGDGALFESVYVSLDAAKNPWRNGTMHVENKYTEEEVLAIWAATKSLMKKLAIRINENGLPRA